MKLSEAIRLGAMSVPPVNGPVVTWDGIDDAARPCGACLLGAVLLATEAISFTEYHRIGACDPQGGWVGEMYARIQARWPWTRDEVTWNGYTGPVPNVAMLSFEFSQKTREDIADWVESIERAQEPPEALQALSLVGVGIE